MAVTQNLLQALVLPQNYFAVNLHCLKLLTRMFI